MPAVKALCSRAILLNNGKLELDDTVDRVVNSYLTGDSDEMARTGVIPDDAPRIYSTGEAKLRSVRLMDVYQNNISQLYLGQPFRVQVNFEVFKEIAEAVIEIGIVAMDGTHVTHSSNIDGDGAPLPLMKGRNSIEVELQPVLLPRQYTLLVGLHHTSGVTIEWMERTLDFTVLRVAESGTDSYRWPSVRGYIRPPAKWFTREGQRPEPVDLLVGGHK
jgi:lipopolysaccharide transport system ATP-binding protein